MPNPAWLPALLRTKFYGTCSIHAVQRRSELNLFDTRTCVKICQHCAAADDPDSLSYGIPNKTSSNNSNRRDLCSQKSQRAANPNSSLHQSSRSDHAGDQAPTLADPPTLLHISRYMYHDVVLLREATAWLDVANIQPYLNNGHRVLYLDRSSQPKSRLAPNAASCKVCTRTLQHPYLYCSIKCKLAPNLPTPEMASTSSGASVVPLKLHQGRVKNLPSSAASSRPSTMSAVLHNSPGHRDRRTERAIIGNTRVLSKQHLHKQQVAQSSPKVFHSLSNSRSLVRTPETCPNSPQSPPSVLYSFSNPKIAQQHHIDEHVDSLTNPPSPISSIALPPPSRKEDVISSSLHIRPKISKHTTKYRAQHTVPVRHHDVKATLGHKRREDGHRFSASSAKHMCLSAATSRPHHGKGAEVDNVKHNSTEKYAVSSSLTDRVSSGERKWVKSDNLRHTCPSLSDVSHDAEELTNVVSCHNSNVRKSKRKGHPIHSPAAGPKTVLLMRQTLQPLKL